MAAKQVDQQQMLSITSSLPHSAFNVKPTHPIHKLG